MNQTFENNLKLTVLTISDKGFAGEREDRSGRYLIDFFKEKGWEIISYDIIPDEIEMIKEKLIEICDNNKSNLVLTTGGTGFSLRDVTPEATRLVVEKEAPGISEAIRMESREKTPRSILSRGVSGIRKQTLIINLPGSINGVKDSIEAIYEVLPHGIYILTGENSECGQ
jgi:molybdopterin adenylyltransferase